MNHYERLKVSQDAPAEVIRAAYRALAGKLHPDRQGAETGPNDAMHAQMAALNAAYETLIDPKLRQDYDATLGPVHASVSSGRDDDEARQGPSTRVDMEWLTPKSATAQQSIWPPSRRLTVLGGLLGASILLAGSVWFWQLMGQHQMERALSDQYASHPADQHVTQASAESQDNALLAADRRVATPATPAVADVAAPVQTAAPAGRRPSVEELSHMSDEELLKVLPTMDGEASRQVAASRLRTAAGGAPAHHPLDGRPLSLRADRQLIDPLAPEAVDKAGK